PGRLTSIPIPSATMRNEREQVKSQAGRGTYISDNGSELGRQQMIDGERLASGSSSLGPETGRKSQCWRSALFSKGEGTRSPPRKDQRCSIGWDDSVSRTNQLDGVSTCQHTVVKVGPPTRIGGRSCDFWIPIPQREGGS